jgi:hypothetical protein
MLEYKPRIRSNKLVTSWIPTQETKNRGTVPVGTYYPPVAGGGIWTPRTLPSPFRNTQSYAMNFANDRFFMANSNAQTVTSTDGITWTVQGTGTGVDNQIAHYDYIYGNYIWSYGSYGRSTNLSTWTNATWSSIMGWNTTVGVDGVQLPTKYLMLAMRMSFPSIGRNSCYVLSTTNGTSWTGNLIAQYKNASSFGSTIKYGNGVVVAMISNAPLGTDTGPEMWKSTDLGLNWTQVTTLPLATFSGIGYHRESGKWILACSTSDVTPAGGGTQARVYTSPDLVTWTLAKTYVNTEFGHQIYPAFVNAQGLAIFGGSAVTGGFGAGSRAVVTSDAVNFEVQDTKLLAGLVTGHLANGNGVWVASNYNPEASTSIQGGFATEGLVLSVDAANTASYPLPRTGTVWYDISGNSNNGNFVRNVTWQSNDQGRMNIDGPTKSYVSIPNSSSLQFGTVFSIQAWIRPTYMGARHSIFSTRLAGSGGGFSLECGTNEAGTNRIGVSGVGTWIYRSADNVCYTRNGSTQAMYVNGVLISPASTAAYTISNNAANKAIGIGNIETTEFYGQIAKVQVYNRVLLPSEILSNYLLHKTVYQP